jgi:HAE1 family hydrophobic/amphiphilic exporter-1
MDEAAFLWSNWQENCSRFISSAGVAQVNIIGGQEREIQVNLDATKMRGYGLSIHKYNKLF